MSVDSCVILRDDRLPRLAEWQRALDKANSGIVLDHVDDLRVHSGYLPAKFNGHQSGFEWYYGTLANAFPFDESLDNVGDRTHVADFVTHSDARELVCALIAGAVLAQLADGLAYHEDSGGFVEADRALEIAMQAEHELL